MSTTVRGVVARSLKAPVEVTEIVVPDPGPGEVTVDVQACGVCHTDLHYREGGINDDFPFLLGHEAAGIVDQVGPDVTEVAPGDFVVLNWRAVCGQCRACRRGQAAVLLRHPQRHPEDDPDRRHRAVARARHRRLRREDAGRRRPGHQGRPGARPGGRRPARLRRDGRLRRRDEHRRGRPGRLGRGVRLRRRRRRRHRRRRAWPAPATIIAVDLDATEARAGPQLRRHPHRRRVRRSTRSRPSARSPTATAPTCASRRSATPRCSSRRSSPATWPARSCRSACPPRT